MAKMLFMMIVLVMSGCAQKSNKTKHFPADYAEVLSQKMKKKPPSVSNQQIKQKLLYQYSSWKGTPYQLGGSSKRGIDCSGFVQVTFKNQFNTNLPRTTLQLAQQGTSISKSQLRAGDLVFFKTGRNKRHVGIALGDGNFLHASTSKGVTISNLSNVYWNKHYTFSVRL